MPTGEYKLARQIGGRGHYARVKVDVTPGPPGIVIADSVFAWLKDEYGPEAWEWRDCDDMREGARAGAAYALQNRVAQGPLAHVVVAEIHASPVDTSKADVAFATCFAVWNALSDHGEAQPTLDQDWSSPFHPARVNPPSHIDGAVVLEWAWSDLPFGHVFFADGAVAATIHGLALCRYPDSETIYRFSCNANWEPEQDTDYSSIAEAKTLLPEQYQQAPVAWLKA